MDGLESTLSLGHYDPGPPRSAPSPGALMGMLVFATGVSIWTGAHLVRDVAGFVVGIPAGLWDIDTFAELSNIGTLFAFVLVSAGVIVLRRKQPERRRAFRVPLVPFTPIVSIARCVLLMVGLPLATWIRFFVRLIIGLFIYFLYSQGRSGLPEPTDAA